MTDPAPDRGSQPADRFDLEAMIGEVRMESARMRAAPDFPLDREAEIGIELARLAPAPDRPRLERLADVVEALGRSTPVRARSGGVRRGGRGQKGDGSERNAEMAVAVADALRNASVRLGDLDARLSALERNTGGANGLFLPEPGPAEEQIDLTQWLGQVSGFEEGRLLYAGTQASDRVQAIRSSGGDAYGLAPPGGYDADLRHGDLVAHLHSVADDGLAQVVIEGPTQAFTSSALAELTGELGRVTGRVSVISEAPWWWAQRLGPEAADLAAARPMSADTWMAVLSRAGFAVSARFDATGHSYMVTATRQA